jgi:hypothetical protein
VRGSLPQMRRFRQPQEPSPGPRNPPRAWTRLSNTPSMEVKEEPSPRAWTRPGSRTDRDPYPTNHSACVDANHPRTGTILARTGACFRIGWMEPSPRPRRVPPQWVDNGLTTPVCRLLVQGASHTAPVSKLAGPVPPCCRLSVLRPAARTSYSVRRVH